MGRPSIVRFGKRRTRSAAISKRMRAAPSVLSFKAVNQVLQNVLQVRCHPLRHLHRGGLATMRLSAHYFSLHHCIARHLSACVTLVKIACILPALQRRSLSPLVQGLKSAMQVLMAEVASQPAALGSSVFGYNDAYRRLRPLVRDWRAACTGAGSAGGDPSPPVAQTTLLCQSPTTSQQVSHLRCNGWWRQQA